MSPKLNVLKMMQISEKGQKADDDCDDETDLCKLGETDEEGAVVVVRDARGIHFLGPW